MPLSGYPELQSGVLLCVDDNEDALECQRLFLESFGYTVLTAPVEPRDWNWLQSTPLRL
jgi:CheY-like chemotaxis protein